MQVILNIFLFKVLILQFIFIISTFSLWGWYWMYYFLPYLPVKLES